MRSVLLMALGVAAMSCSPDSSPQVGGETHWLAVCSEDSDCGRDGLQCICSTCTKPCVGDGACGGGQCYDTKSPLLVQRCDDFKTEQLPAICLAQCDRDAECGSGRSCAQGTCVPSTADPVIRIGDFDGVSDEVSWTETVAITPFVDAIEAATPALFGTWRQPDCDPAAPPTSDMPGCLAIDIEQDAAGAVRGRMRFERAGPVDSLGPFAPPMDPDVGYPREVEVTQYRSLMGGPQLNVTYHLFDGQMFGQRLLFRWSFLDLWHDWCELQRPYLWEVGGRKYYFCVPQDLSVQAQFDEGKIVLCTSGAVEPVNACSTPDNPRCSAAYCACDGERCDIAPSDTLAAQLTFASDGRTATFELLNKDYMFNATLRRSSP
jgi:hypothetical protein